MKEKVATLIEALLRKLAKGVDETRAISMYSEARLEYNQYLKIILEMHLFDEKAVRAIDKMFENLDAMMRLRGFLKSKSLTP